MSSANGHKDFPIQNLPLGVFSPPGGTERRAGCRDRRHDLRPGRGIGVGAVRPRCAGRRRGGVLGFAERAVCARSGAAPSTPGAPVGNLGCQRRERSRLEGSRGRCCIRWQAAPCTCLPASATTLTSTSASTTRPTSARCSGPTTRCCRTTSTFRSATTAEPRSVVTSGTPVRRPAGSSSHRTRPTQASARASARLRAGARRLDRARQCARRADPYRGSGPTRRRLLPAQRLVGPGHPGLGVPASRAVLVQELRDHGVTVGDHARGAGAVPHSAAAACGRGSKTAAVPLRRSRPAGRRLRHRAGGPARDPWAPGEGNGSPPARPEQHEAHVLDGIAAR